MMIIKQKCFKNSPFSMDYHVLLFLLISNSKSFFQIDLAAAGYAALRGEGNPFSKFESSFKSCSSGLEWRRLLKDNQRHFSDFLIKTFCCLVDNDDAQHSRKSSSSWNGRITATPILLRWLPDIDLLHFEKLEWRPCSVRICFVGIQVTGRN